jgi:sensor histidine kinase regulating citrate/malate metabolism
VKDGNIGMGLACSLAIAKKLGGDITLKESQRGFTVFAFQIPVRKKDIADISICRQ